MNLIIISHPILAIEYFMIYKDSEQLLKDKEGLKKVYENKSSYFIRSGIVLSLIREMSNNIKILELGCSNGKILKALFDSGYKNLNFIDIDNYLVDEEIKSLNKLQKVDLNKDSLPYPDDSIDICLAIAIFEHIENPWHLKREIKRVLASGGKLLLAVPHHNNLIDRIRFLFSGNLSGYRKDNDHITVQTKDIFSKCYLSDFKITKEIYSPGFIKFSGKKIKLPKSFFLNKLFGRKVLYILEKI